MRLVVLSLVMSIMFVRYHFFFVLMCRIIGAVLVVAGLYLVVWGKSKEREFDEEKPSVSENSNGESSRHDSLIQPLLPTSST